MTAFAPKKTKPAPGGPTELPDTSVGWSEGGLSAGFTRDLEKARKALSGLVARLRRIRREPEMPARVGGVSSAELVARLQMGLKKEHDLVLVPLLNRLEGFSTVLNAGGDVPFSVIEEGLALVDRYLHELHDAHLRMLETAGVDRTKGDSGRLALQQLASDYEHARVRWATVRVMMHGYQGKTPASRALLGLTLAQECRAERAWHDFEEEYVKSSVPPLLPPKVAEVWRLELDRSRDEGRADRIRIEDWVRRTESNVPSPS